MTFDASEVVGKLSHHESFDFDLILQPPNPYTQETYQLLILKILETNYDMAYP